MRPQPVTASGDYLVALLGREFTAEQMAIITAPLQPQLVVAGAGSGKTTVMAARVVHAVAHFGVDPSRILGLTFTNKAAGELAERVRRSLARLPGHDGSGSAGAAGFDDVPTIATYHSYAAQIVRDHALRIGREPNATLLTEAAQWQLAMRVATRAPGPFEHLTWTTGYVAGLIVALAGELSDHLAPIEVVRAHDERVLAAVAALPDPRADAKRMVGTARSRAELLDLVEEYRRQKERLDLVDFGDQVALAAAIAEASPEVAAIERDRFAMVVLDEYQDTGVAQRELLRRLFGGTHAVTAVGDTYQAIYGWRGASIGNLLHFLDHFAPGAERTPVLPLMTSFRCQGRILDAANAVVAPLRAASAAVPGASEIPLLRPTPDAVDAGDVVVARLTTALDEAAWLAARIAAALAAGVAAREVAVLSRRRADFARLHRAMVACGIPVEVVGLGGLLEMPEVNDIVAVLSLLADPTANEAAVRLLSGPRWRIGVRDLAALGDRARYLTRARPIDDGLPVAEGLDRVLEDATSQVDPVEVPSLLDAVESPGPSSRCSPEALERFACFAAEIGRLRGLADQPLVDLVNEVVAVTGLDIEIAAGDAALATARLANVHAFLDVAAAFTGLEGEADLAAFLAYLNAARDNEDGLELGAVSDADTVKLMTVHAAKGLEWDVVAIPGLVEDVFPTNRVRSPWTGAAYVLPFDCRGDAADLPVLGDYSPAGVKAFVKACRDDAADEERRLAYVAMTRARSCLWLSSYVWSPTRKEPVQPSRFLTEVAALAAPAVHTDGWGDDPEPGADNPLLAAGAADVPWPVVPDAADLERRRSGADLVVAALAAAGMQTPLTATAGAGSVWRDADLLLAEARQARVRQVDVEVPRRLTTSQIVALARDPDAFAASLARPVPTAPAPAARRGSRFHRWVEQLYGAAPLLDADDLPGAEDADLTDDELAALQAAFLESGWGERRPVAVEAPFEMVIGGRLIRGRIDAIYRSSDGRYDVIDFKTGSVPRDFATASLQLAVYRLAWADLAGVDPAEVDSGFLYVGTGEVKRPTDLPDRDELDALLSVG